MTPVAFAAIAFTAILVLLALFQLALIFGAPLARFTWGGSRTPVLPTKLRALSAVAVAVYAVSAFIALIRAGVIPGPGGLGPSSGPVQVAMWAVFAFFAFSVLASFSSASKAERSVMGPVLGILALLGLFIGLGTPGS